MAGNGRTTKGNHMARIDDYVLVESEDLEDDDDREEAEEDEDDADAALS